MTEVVEDKKYAVALEVKYNVDIEVVASSGEEAIELAKEEFEESGIGEYNPEFMDYDYEEAVEIKDD